MEEITNLETIKYGNGEEYYIYRFGLFFSGGVSELEDDYGFKFLISKDLSNAFLVNDRGNFKVVSIDEVISSIESIKVLSGVTKDIYSSEVLDELIVKPPVESDIEGLS